ncbi:MAG: hypothetical protein GX626_02505 [Spirochaetales bacterium]|jgi:hypothetical protein|nr:hypothetical protein [Spirochaetales bacterium]
MTDYLFATPSIIEGIARNLDLFGTLNVYNTSKTPQEADLRAHQNDLRCLKNDMNIAISEVLDGNENKERS